MKFLITHLDDTQEVVEYPSIKAMKKSLKPNDTKYKAISVISDILDLLGRFIVLMRFILPKKAL